MHHICAFPVFGCFSLELAQNGELERYPSKNFMTATESQPPNTPQIPHKWMLIIKLLVLCLVIHDGLLLAGIKQTGQIIFLKFETLIALVFLAVIMKYYAEARNLQTIGLLAFFLFYFTIDNQFSFRDHRDHSFEYQRVKGSFFPTTNEKDEINQYMILDDVAFEAALSDHVTEAKAAADKLLELAEKYKNYKDNNQKSLAWRYGDAIHMGHTVLGLLALKNNNIDEAKQHLLLSGQVDGSPVLNSFGPNMTLARELLKKSERDSVLKYFDECDRFWSVPFYWRWFIKMGFLPSFSGKASAFSQEG